MEVQVIARQVGETADGEPDGVHPAEGQRVAGHLHHHGVDATLDHHREQGLQVGSLGRGQHARFLAAVDPDADGADEAGHPSGGPQPGLDQIRGGGLARGARHADDAHVFRWSAVHLRRQLAEHSSRRGMDQHGRSDTAAHDLDSRLVGEHRDGTLPDGIRGVARPVRRRPGSAANRSPGRTSWLRNVTPVTRTCAAAASASGCAWIRSANATRPSPAGLEGRKFMAMTPYRPSIGRRQG